VPVLTSPAGHVTQLVVLESCGHCPMDEKPEEVLAELVTFLNEHVRA
jgi:pimeloyl-ACP methyl ester carboxylesterase